MVINRGLGFTPGQKIKCPQRITWCGRTTSTAFNNILATMPSTMEVMSLGDIFRKSRDASLILITNNSHHRTINGRMIFNRKFPEQTPILCGLSSKQDGESNWRHVRIRRRCVCREQSIFSELDVSGVGLNHLQ